MGLGLLGLALTSGCGKLEEESPKQVSEIYSKSELIVRLPFPPEFVTFVDIDNDGDVDLVQGGRCQVSFDKAEYHLYVIRNNGEGYFEESR